jgi:hypothetical protein
LKKGEYTSVSTNYNKSQFFLYMFNYYIKY